MKVILQERELGPPSPTLPHSEGHLPLPFTTSYPIHQMYAINIDIKKNEHVCENEDVPKAIQGPLWESLRRLDERDCTQSSSPCSRLAFEKESSQKRNSGRMERRPKARYRVLCNTQRSSAEVH